ncbi:MAG: excinuclease ABC subunit UvrC [Gammaproteobacteria bacterium]
MQTHKSNLYAQAQELPASPGIYQMIESDRILYVGKAASLRNRVSSYFSGRAANTRITQLVSLVERFAVTVTRTEAEALLLEDQLIKKHRPFYNIMLRDDKTYPWIRISDHQWPAISLHRGTQTYKGRYFGPFASAGASRETINEICRAFRLRNCSDSVFYGRSRPCLQYQIGRCTAPCVGLIDEESYRKDCHSARRFLSGDSADVLTELGEEMSVAAESLDYERASRLRDRLTSLHRVREKQAIYAKDSEADCDVIAASTNQHLLCITMLQIRQGRLQSSSAHFPKMPRQLMEEQPLHQAGIQAFLSQWYLSNPVWIPPVVMLPPKALELSECELLAAVFSKLKGRKVQVKFARQQQAAEWLKLAETNAENSLQEHVRDRSRFARRLVALGKEMGMQSEPSRIECLDVSHHGGEQTTVSCVVFEHTGPVRSKWRAYKLGALGGDDYEALRVAIHKKFSGSLSRSREAQEQPEHILPDILVIDGGKGQLSSVYEALDQLGIEIPLVLAIAKGPSRKDGKEQLFCGREAAEAELLPNTEARLLVQYVRDEAHKFAIKNLRRRLRSARKQSLLEQIPGIGPMARQALLQHFGGIQQIKRADTDALCAVSGIGRERAQIIYEHLHR